MQANELNAEIAIKTLELERAREMGKPMEEIMQLYKELKQLQYEKVQAELSKNSTDRAEPPPRTR